MSRRAPSRSTKEQTQPSTNKPGPVCILGMHRSGTSHVTRIMNLLGLYLGPEHLLMPAREDNPEGFWELAEFVSINEAILKTLGGSWRDVPAFHASWQDAPDIRELAERAQAFIEREFAGRPLWGWKDPRNCLTTPFWSNLLPNLRFVVCIRNPLEVARSLADRNNFSIDSSSALWNAYTLSALENTAPRPRLFSFFEDCFVDLEGEIARLATFMGCPIPAPGSAVLESIRSVVREDLWHQRASVQDMLGDEELRPASKGLYVGLSAALGKPCVREGTSSALLLQSSYARGREIAGELEKAQAKAAEMQAQVKQRTEWAQKLDAELEEARTRIKGLHAEIDERTEWARRLDDRLAGARDRVSQLEKELTERTTWAKDLNVQVNELRGELQARDEREARAASDLQSVRAAVDELQQTAEQRTVWARQLDAELAETRELVAALQTTVEERTAWAQGLDEELGVARARLRDLQRTAEREKERAQQLDLTVEELQKEVDAVRTNRARAESELRQLKSKHVLVPKPSLPKRGKPVA